MWNDFWSIIEQKRPINRDQNVAIFRVGVCVCVHSVSLGIGNIEDPLMNEME